MDDVVRNYARDVLGMQREDLNEFLWIADEAMRAPLPDGWEQHEDESRGKPYYVNEDTGETQWTHPSDDFYPRSSSGSGASGGRSCPRATATFEVVGGGARRGGRAGAGRRRRKGAAAPA